MTVRGVSDWGDKDLTVKDFFLGKSDFPSLYHAGELRYREYLRVKETGQNPHKTVLPPVEQLSAKGIALMSYLYAQKDNNEAQPVIADSVENLKHISKLMEEASVGTTVTVIFQPTKKEGAPWPGLWREFSSVHKTVIKFERTSDGLRLIQLDGTNNGLYTFLSSEVIKNALEESAQEKSRERTKIQAYIGVAKEYGLQNERFENLSRQQSEFECGIFAIKDAREMNRETDFHDKHLGRVEKIQYLEDPLFIAYNFEVPVKYKKSAQSIAAYKALLKEFGNEVVTRKGKTLQQTFDKHVDSYVNHFGQKYNEQVVKYVEGKEQREIKAAVEKYDAGKMTLDRLERIYGMKQLPKNTKRITNVK